VSGGRPDSAPAASKVAGLCAARGLLVRGGMRLVWLLCLFGCLDEPLPRGPAEARLVVGWDPLACGEPHRVAIELADDAGAPLAASTPCNLGAITVDIAHLGVYRGRIYAWALAAPVRSEAALEVSVDEPIVHWHVETPR
jgi:hypothetical protein